MCRKDLCYRFCEKQFKLNTVIWSCLFNNMKSNNNNHKIICACILPCKESELMQESEHLCPSGGDHWFQQSHPADSHLWLFRCPQVQAIHISCSFCVYCFPELNKYHKKHELVNINLKSKLNSHQPGQWPFI